MPSIVFCTTSAPLRATDTELWATFASSSASSDTLDRLLEISLIDADASVICRAWCSDASERRIEVARVSFEEADTDSAVFATLDTRWRSSPIAKLIASAIAPVKSSDTVASTRKSPSPRSAISSSRRIIASWFDSLVFSVSSRFRRVPLYTITPKPSSARTITIEAIIVVRAENGRN